MKQILKVIVHTATQVQAKLPNRPYPFHTGYVCLNPLVSN